jgi:hypothetical protein
MPSVQVCPWLMWKAAVLEPLVGRGFVEAFHGKFSLTPNISEKPLDFNPSSNKYEQ